MRVCAVTGSRADWGLLRPVLHRLRDSSAVLQLVATGSHLNEAFGLTLSDIEADGFIPDRCVPLDRRGDHPRGVAAAMASAITGLAGALDELHPDIVLILGDRYEIFAAAQAALLLRIPVAHIAGGDISEGAFDDAIRHAISKLSHLHFTTHAAARRRVLQLGEPAERVFDTGSPGIDALLETPRWDRATLEQRLGFGLRERNLAVTFHPATLDPAGPAAQVEPLLDALDRLGPDIGLVFTGANADDGGERINRRIQAYVADRANACFHLSLGQAGYYSLVAEADLVVGNSSSGLYEAASLGTPTLDIGVRQQGRLRGPGVRHARNDAEQIHAAIVSMLNDPPRELTNPYGDGRASERIVDVLLSITDPRSLLIKHFAEWPDERSR